MSLLYTLMSLAATLDLSARSYRVPLGSEVQLIQQHFSDALLCARLRSSKQDRFLSLVMEKASSWAVCSWPSAVGAQAGVGCGKPGCSQAGEGAFPEGMSWEQRALYLCQRVFLGGAQTLCALTFPFCKRTSEFPFFSEICCFSAKYLLGSRRQTRCVLGSAATFVVTHFVPQMGKPRLRKDQGGLLALSPLRPAKLIPTRQRSAWLHVIPCSQDPGLTGSLVVLDSFLIKGPAYVSFDDLDGAHHKMTVFS